MDWVEGRRLQGWKLLQAGWRQVEVAKAVGVTKGAVSQWVKRVKEGGPDALLRRKAPGAVSKLSQAQLAALPELLACGAEAYGFRGQVWTHPRIAKVIQDKMGVHYHPNHIPRLLKKITWTRQKPRRRASGMRRQSNGGTVLNGRVF